MYSEDLTVSILNAMNLNLQYLFLKYVHSSVLKFLNHQHTKVLIKLMLKYI